VIIDVGGESTRPGAQPVAPEDEIARVVPTIQRIRSSSDETVKQMIISIDTMKSKCAKTQI